MNEDKPLMDLLALDMEYRLTVAYRLSNGDECICPDYLVRRREVLLPAIIEEATKSGKEPVDVFHSFQNKLHARHEKDIP